MRWLLLIVVSVLVIVGVVLVDRRHRTAGTGDHADELALGPFDSDITANQLMDAYTANEVAADHQYRDKALRVTGIVVAIKKTASGSPFLIIGARRPLGLLAIFKNDSGISLLKPRDEMTARCTGDGVLAGSPKLRDCVLE
jgi:hypothetical protein